MAESADPPKPKRQTREEKLASALRANLRRRKAAPVKATPSPRPKKADREV